MCWVAKNIARLLNKLPFCQHEYYIFTVCLLCFVVAYVPIALLCLDDVQHIDCVWVWVIVYFRNRWYSYRNFICSFSIESVD
jgi:hypothetical protein